MDTQSHEANTVVAFFDERADAERAVERLDEAGVPSERVTMVEGSKPDSAAHEGESREGFIGSLRDMFMPEDDRDSYAEGLRRGGYLVSVRAQPDEYERVVDILDAEGSIDMDERQASWRSEGWSGGKGGTIEVAEEQMRIGKRDVSHGRVRVRSYTVVDDVSEDVTLRTETVRVERRSVDRAATDADAAFEDREIEVEEIAEEPVISKEARVVEEIEVTKDVETRTETVSDTVRRTEVDIEDGRKS